MAPVASGKATIAPVASVAPVSPGTAPAVTAVPVGDEAATIAPADTTAPVVPATASKYSGAASIVAGASTIAPRTLSAAT